MMSVQTKFTEKFHWLKELPENILETLDYSEFFDPSQELLKSVLLIGSEYDVNVMLYNERSDGIPEQGKRHLCTTIKSASIPDSAIKKLLEIEKFAYKDRISVVCYRKPVEIRARA